MYGRNGTDQLNIALCAVYMVLWLLCSIILAFVDSQIVNTVLSFLTSAILVAVILRTSLGTLCVHGRELQLKTLTQNGGQVAVEGTVSALIYEEPRSQGGWLRRLLG